MRSILQLCLMVLMLLGAGNRVWGKVAVGQNIAVRGFEQSGAFCNGADAPPALMSSGEMAAWGYDLASDVRDGPNLYAYVKQNPWTAFDPDGLAETKGYYKNKRGVTRLEADEHGEPLTRVNNGKLEVHANHYTDWGDKYFSWFNGPQGEPNSSGWEPAKKYGVKQPTSSARRTVDTNENWDPNKNLQAFGDAANHPTVQAVGTVARVSIELSAMMMTGGMSGARAPLQAAQNGKFTVGAYNEIRGTVAGLDAHHVGQRALMQKLVPGYDAMAAPSILLPKVGHTIKGPNGIISRSTQGLNNVRDVIARDIKEIRRVYPDAPNSQLQNLIQMNKDLYPGSFVKPAP